MHNQDKQKALTQIKELIVSHRLEKDDLFLAMKESGIELGPKRALSTLFQYLGGILIFSAIIVFVSMHWGQLGNPARIILTLGSGLVCYSLAWLYGTSRLATILFLMAIPLEPTGMFIAVDTVLNLPNFYSGLTAALIFSVMGAQFFIAYKVKKLPVLLNGIIIFWSIAYTAFFTWFDHKLKWPIESEQYFAVYGFALLSITYFLRNTFHTAIVTELWYGFSALMLYANLFDWFERSWLEIIYVLTLVAGLFLSSKVRSLLLSIVSILGILFYVGYITDKHFEDIIAWPIALFVMGLCCLWLRKRW